LTAGFRQYFGVEMKLKVFSNEEKAEIKAIQEDRYEDLDWNARKGKTSH